jgi:hypothetical protein
LEVFDMKRANALILLSLPLALGFLVGCPWSPAPGIKTPDPRTKILAQSSAVNVLANLKTAYEAKNIEEYLKLFSSDFIFVFNPADADNPTNPTPPQWGLAQESTSTTNMFSDDRVDTITLDFQENPVEPDSVEHGAGTWKMRVYEAFLQVNTRNENNELLTYQVPGTTQMFYFREVPGVLATDGKPTWYIFRWEDQPIGAKSPPVAAVPGKPDA